MWLSHHKNPENVVNEGNMRPLPPVVVDIHCHCLPGLDDGPKDTEAALALCRQMVADGTSVAIATPHQLGSYERRNSASEVRAAAVQLNQSLVEAGIPLKVHPGAEVRIDGQLIELLKIDSILTLLDQSRHLLLELPGEPLIDLQPVIKLLMRENISLIVAHPERQRPLRRRFDLLRKWADLGCAFQINAPSLVGAGSPDDCQMAWKMLDAGLVDFVASDCHSVHRRPSMLAKATQLLMSRAGYSVTRRICSDNPAAVLAGEPIRTLRSLPVSGVTV